jgi:hypothetical protein
MTETRKLLPFYLQNLVHFTNAADFGQYRPLPFSIILKLFVTVVAKLKGRVLCFGIFHNFSEKNPLMNFKK